MTVSRSQATGNKDLTSYHNRFSFFLKKVKRQRQFLLILLPFIVYVLIFKYWPMYGNLLAFKNYSYKAGILGSEWAGFKWFEMFLNSSDFYRSLKNTLVLSFLRLIFCFPAPILLAILINEISNRRYKRAIQTISYLPHFISWIVVVGIVMNIFSIDGGAVNSFLVGTGILKEPFNFLGSPKAFWWLLTGLAVWKDIGFNSIIFIAAITSIDSEQYESAIIDGAGRLKQVWYITLPGIMPTVVVLFIFTIGYLLNIGFEQYLFLQNPMNSSTSEVLDTYVFKMGLRQGLYSFGQAVSLLKGIVGLMMVIVANRVVKKITDMGIF